MHGERLAGVCNPGSPRWGRSSVGRAPGLQPGGHEFEPRRLHQPPNGLRDGFRRNAPWGA
jgi:hypothetical protein